MAPASALDWDSFDSIFLDMDGTLLDLRFDNWFWLSLIPSRYAAAHGCSEEQARALLAPKFDGVARTLQWYCIDHWTRELGLDIASLKRESQARVVFLPGAEVFLQKLRRRGKRVVLLTNAHPAVLAIKDERVALTRHFDACYSSQAFAAPKEDTEFWRRLAQREAFVPARTLFVDDSLPVLECARAFGIGHLRAVRRPDSAAPPCATGDFAAIEGVADLL